MRTPDVLSREQLYSCLQNCSNTLTSGHATIVALRCTALKLNAPVALRVCMLRVMWRCSHTAMHCARHLLTLRCAARDANASLRCTALAVATTLRSALHSRCCCRCCCSSMQLKLAGEPAFPLTIVMRAATRVKSVHAAHGAGAKANAQ